MAWPNGLWTDARIYLCTYATVIVCTSVVWLKLPTALYRKCPRKVHFTSDYAHSGDAITEGYNSSTGKDQSTHKLPARQFSKQDGWFRPRDSSEKNIGFCGI